MGTRIDGIELEILWQRLIAIMDEVDTIICLLYTSDAADE